jgi:hypothetical protein
MTHTPKPYGYFPGFYSPKRPSTAQMIDRYARSWEAQRAELRKKAEKAVEVPIPPTISISRKIGVGAVEIADILEKKINHRVVDRDIIEQIAQESNLSQATVGMFDERYPGWREEFMALLFGEKSFIKSDYNRKLFETVLSIAAIESTTFVGRGTHLILPRDRVLAVRLICSTEGRVARLAKIMGITKSEARAELERVDKEQRDFFKKTFNKKDAPNDEFDLVINRDFFSEAEWVAAVIERAFKEKFGQ